LCCCLAPDSSRSVRIPSQGKGLPLSLARLVIVVSDSSLAMLAGCVVSRRHGLTLVLVGSCLTLRATRALVWPLLRDPERAAWDSGYGVHAEHDPIWSRPIFAPTSLSHPDVPTQTVTAQPLVQSADTADLLGHMHSRRVSR